VQALSFVVTPENTVVVFKDPRGAVLKCSVSTNVSVDWLFYDINGTAGSPCYVYKDAESAGGYDMCTDVSRFSVQPARSSDSSVAFDLVILRALYSDAGTYVCVESNSGRQAAALLGVIGNSRSRIIIASANKKVVFSLPFNAFVCRQDNSKSCARILILKKIYRAAASRAPILFTKSVRPSVRHTLVLHLKECTYRQTLYTAL